ncbi:hypothetical protein U1Q18_017421 [Sarracenia purpurea var. burkii]
MKRQDLEGEGNGVVRGIEARRSISGNDGTTMTSSTRSGFIAVEDRRMAMAVVRSNDNDGKSDNRDGW